MLKYLVFVAIIASTVAVLMGMTTKIILEDSAPSMSETQEESDVQHNDLATITQSQVNQEGESATETAQTNKTATATETEGTKTLEGFADTDCYTSF